VLVLVARAASGNTAASLERWGWGALRRGCGWESRSAGRGEPCFGGGDVAGDFVHVDRRYVQAELKILTGLVERI